MIDAREATELPIDPISAMLGGRPPRGFMANRKATFAKRQRETDLKERAKQKEDRRSAKRGEVRENKGPQIAWDEAVHAVTSSDDELPPLGPSRRDDQAQDDDPSPAGAGSSGDAPSSSSGAAAPGDVSSPRRVG